MMTPIRLSGDEKYRREEGVGENVEWVLSCAGDVGGRRCQFNLVVWRQLGAGQTSSSLHSFPNRGGVTRMDNCCD